MAITSWTATGGDWEDPAFERAWDGPAISPAKGDITLSSSIPIGKLQFFTSPGVANLEIVQSYEWDQLTNSWINTTGDWGSGPIPQMAVGSNVSVDKADLTFTAYSPDIGRMYKFVISAPTLTLTGSAPTDVTIAEVEETAKPVQDGYTAEESTPELVDDVWKQKWILVENTWLESRIAAYGNVDKQIEFITENGLEAWQTKVAEIKVKYPKS